MGTLGTLIKYCVPRTLPRTLRGLEKDAIEFWTDQKIRPGEFWDDVIKSFIQQADIALVLVNQSFLDSDYCQNVEIRDFLAGKTHLFPVILSPCDWRRHEWLKIRQFLPGGDQTVEEHFQDVGNRKRLFLQVRHSLLERAQLIRQNHSDSIEPSSNPSKPAHSYSGKTKIEFCDRLGDDWKRLADCLEISSSDQARFHRGDEGRGIWVWLDNREDLTDLPDALKAIGRTDLAERLDNREKHDELAEGLTFIRRHDLIELLEPEATLATTDQKKWTGSPYPGLSSFSPDEAPIFFGRDKEINTLINRLGKPANRFLAVIGASGSGKSSLVAAGLIPGLSEGTGDKSWLWTRMTPGEMGDDPFWALAAALKPLLQSQGYDARKIYQELSGTGNIGPLVRVLLAQEKADIELLVFIDQFEEFFTQVAEEHRKPFTILLGKMAKTPRLRIVLTLRADFYHRCLDYPSLEKLLQSEAATFPLATPDQWALMEMITSPAAITGLSFEDDLPGRILRDTGSEPGSLALMAFALAELYQQCQPDKELTLESYKSFGGVQGAIARRADAAYAQLDVSTHQALGEVFTELVEVDAGRGISTRKRAPLSAFKSPAALAFIEKFASPEVRLLVMDDPKQQEAIAEVAHEALLTHWPRLSIWIEERLDDLRLRRQLQHAARDWEAHDRTEAYLWSDERVMEARAMLARIGYQPSKLELAFLGPIDPANMLEEIENPTTSHQRCALTGDRLGLVGDSRPGVGLRPDGLPDIVWCEVPGGGITLGDDAGTYPVESFYFV